MLFPETFLASELFKLNNVVNLKCVVWSLVIAMYLTFSFLGRVRFHYGHPDVFDRIFHITRGGISKASCGINLSEDIFAGMYFSTYSNCYLWIFEGNLRMDRSLGHPHPRICDSNWV